MAERSLSVCHRQVPRCSTTRVISGEQRGFPAEPVSQPQWSTVPRTEAPPLPPSGHLQCSYPYLSTPFSKTTPPWCVDIGDLIPSFMSRLDHPRPRLHTHSSSWPRQPSHLHAGGHPGVSQGPDTPTTRGHELPAVPEQYVPPWAQARSGGPRRRRRRPQAAGMAA